MGFERFIEVRSRRGEVYMRSLIHEVTDIFGEIGVRAVNAKLR